MNFKNKILIDLEAIGLNSLQAEEVFKLFKDDSFFIKYLQTRWTEDVSLYPEFFYEEAWFACEKIAAKYIEKNYPNIWFRPYFLSAVELDSLIAEIA